ncbi:MAG TPA: hypothetical protein VM938_08520 [Acidimicrobiales bacterium]|nr:hypothetical protein [Acidimicrobiales bacterium]
MLGTGAFWSTVRLFVALRPPTSVVDRVRSLPRLLHGGGARCEVVERWVLEPNTRS